MFWTVCQFRSLLIILRYTYLSCTIFLALAADKNKVQQLCNTFIYCVIYYRSCLVCMQDAAVPIAQTANCRRNGCCSVHVGGIIRQSTSIAVVSTIGVNLNKKPGLNPFGPSLFPSDAYISVEKCKVQA
jgi:hypothetical protein